MKQPTRAQRAILERMAAGKEMRAGQYGTVFLESERGGLKDIVMSETVAVLLREGWIECSESRTYTLTEAGRQEAARPQRVGAEAGEG